MAGIWVHKINLSVLKLYLCFLKYCIMLTEISSLFQSNLCFYDLMTRETQYRVDSLTGVCFMSVSYSHHSPPEAKKKVQSTYFYWYKRRNNWHSPTHFPYLRKNSLFIQQSNVRIYEPNECWWNHLNGRSCSKLPL